MIRRQTFDPRSARQAFFDAQDGYDYVIKDLEPNTIYDIQVNAYYETGMNLESNWETTSCHTEMQSKSLMNLSLVGPKILQFK